MPPKNSRFAPLEIVKLPANNSQHDFDALMSAIKAGDSKKVTELMQTKKIDIVNTKNTEGKSAIAFAIDMVGVTPEAFDIVIRIINFISLSENKNALLQKVLPLLSAELKRAKEKMGSLSILENHAQILAQSNSSSAPKKSNLFDKSEAQNSANTVTGEKRKKDDCDDDVVVEDSEDDKQAKKNRHVIQKK